MTSRRERYDAWRAGFLAGQRAARGDEAAAGAAPYHDDGYDSFEDEWMTKTNAKQVYHLNEADLRKLPVQRKPNPVDGRFAPMCLYKVAHLQRASEEKIAAREAKRQARKAEKAANHSAPAKRTTAIQRALLAAGVSAAERDAIMIDAAVIDFVLNGSGRHKPAPTADSVVEDVLRRRGIAGGGGGGGAGGAAAGTGAPHVTTPARKAKRERDSDSDSREAVIELD